MQRPSNLATLVLGGICGLAVAAPEAHALSFDFSSVPNQDGIELPIDADGDAVNDLVFRSLSANNGNPLPTLNPSAVVAPGVTPIFIGSLDFPQTRALTPPYLWGTPAAGQDLKIGFPNGVTNSFRFDLSLFAFNTSLLDVFPGGTYALFDINDNQIGTDIAFDVFSRAFSSAENGIDINLNAGERPYSMIIDFVDQLPVLPNGEVGSSDLVLIDGFVAYGLDNLEGTFGSSEYVGLSPANPLLPNNPTSPGSGFEFAVTLPNPNTIIFIDPLVAIGYTYAITGDLFDTVQAPSNLTDKAFDLLVCDATCSSFMPLAGLSGGVPFNFTTPVSCFQILGIDVAEALDPANPLAFITGISTVNAGTFSVTQTPITQSIDAVPGPLPLTGAGVAFSFARRLRRRQRGCGMAVPWGG
ncbi:MAG: hypothetical protein ACKO25_01915 [Cyanobium sp.]